MSVTILGRKYPSPILTAPVGVLSIFHEDKEPGVAEVSRELGIPFILSTAASSSMEEVAKASGHGERWYQLYWPSYPDNNDVTESLLKRAKDNGFRVLVVTLDTWQLAWRPADLDNAYVPFIKGVGNEMGFSDPVFQRKFKEKTGKEIKDDIVTASAMWTATCFSGKAHHWSEIKHLQEHWDGPIVLKGIQCVEDAQLAVEAGVQGIIVSNHGGRQCDGAVGSLDQLPEIVDAVGDKLDVLFDSGVRTGVDILKALCLGAKGVLVGRPWCYGLGIAGKRGAKQVMQGLLADADQTMGMSGIKSIKDCTRKMVKQVNYGGDVKAMW
jgi:lactate 2-monooxygenase